MQFIICEWISEKPRFTHNYKYVILEVPILISHIIIIIWSVVSHEGKQIIACNFNFAMVLAIHSLSIYTQAVKWTVSWIASHVRWFLLTTSTHIGVKVGGWWEPWSGGLTLTPCKVKTANVISWSFFQLYITQNSYIHAQPHHPVVCVVIYSQLAVCLVEMEPFNDYPSTCGTQSWIFRKIEEQPFCNLWKFHIYLRSHRSWKIGCVNYARFHKSSHICTCMYSSIWFYFTWR